MGADVGMVRVRETTNGLEVAHDVTFAFVVLAFHPGVRLLTQEGWVMLSSR